MAVVKVAQRPEGENGTLSLSGSTQIYKYYVVECDSLGDDAATVGTANDGTNGIPVLGAALNSTGLVCTEVRPERQGRSAIWVVTVTYGVALNSYEPPSVGKWNVDISVDGVEYQEDTDKDKDGKAIVNSAGDPFDPPLKRSLWDEELTISFNSSTVDTANIDACRGKVNAGSVSCTVKGLTRTWAAKTLKLVKARYGTTVQLNGGTATNCFQVSYVFHYRADSWVHKVEDKGFYAKDADGKKYLITDDHGQPISRPAYLDSTGKELTSGATVHTVDAEIEEPVSFSGLFAGL